MRHDLPPPPDDPTGPAAGGAAGDGASDPLEVLASLSAGYHQLMRDTLVAFCDAGRTPTIVRTGLTPGLLLELDHRLPVPVVRQLESVAQRLHVMPDTATVYTAGIIEFDDLATIVRETRRLSGPALADLDRWAATRATDLAHDQLLHLLAADVADRAAQLRAPGWASRQQRRTHHGSEVRLQQDFDGGGLILGSFDPVGFTTVATSIETIAGPPTPTTTRPRQRADALVTIAEHALTGTSRDDSSGDGGDGDGGGRVGWPAPGQVRLPTRPRPHITVIVDLAQTTTDRFALLQTITGLADTPALTARLTDTLADNARLLVQITHGRRPLTELHAIDIPTAVRRTVTARDRGCRAPGCRRPVRECDVHHIIRRTDGGPHDPDNLALLCRRHHTSIDRHHWHITHNPGTATITWRHPMSGRTYRTVPHGTRPPPLRPHHTALAHWEAPPIPPPPDDNHDPGPPPHDHNRGRDPDDP